MTKQRRTHGAAASDPQHHARSVEKRIERIRSMWTKDDLESRRTDTPELKLALSLLVAGHERIERAMEMLGRIRHVLGDAREALAWFQGTGVVEPLPVTAETDGANAASIVPAWFHGEEISAPIPYDDAVIALGFHPDEVRRKIFSKYQLQNLATLARVKPYFCPVCGPVLDGRRMKP